MIYVYTYIRMYVRTLIISFFLNGMDDWHHNSPHCRFFQQVGYPKWMVVFALFSFPVFFWNSHIWCFLPKYCCKPGPIHFVRQNLAFWIRFVKPEPEAMLVGRYYAPQPCPLDVFMPYNSRSRRRHRTRFGRVTRILRTCQVFLNPLVTWLGSKITVNPRQLVGDSDNLKWPEWATYRLVGDKYYRNVCVNLHGSWSSNCCPRRLEEEYSLMEQWSNSASDIESLH